ncbi:2-oxoadipate dioxygenase/decarboxylase, chloroplastic/amyloplastic-like [Silene latifolia]|uniref:2-oxoadipate dioxygenase/decarboxylase, chloroplastic/amyloplastic-like n=1 Tax=Silene latifolia TaxID=37657 RepID=UPI003D7743CD
MSKRGSEVAVEKAPQKPKKIIGKMKVQVRKVRMRLDPPTGWSFTSLNLKGPLPRVFISELIVDQMSSEAQDIIWKHAEMSSQGNKYGALAITPELLTWEKPLHSEFQ